MRHIHATQILMLSCVCVCVCAYVHKERADVHLKGGDDLRKHEDAEPNDDCVFNISQHLQGDG